MQPMCKRALQTLISMCSRYGETFPPADHQHWNKVVTPDFSEGCTSEARAGDARNHFMWDVLLELVLPVLYR
jgi:hypothetical protein